MFEMSLQGSQNESSDKVVDSLMSFFTDPGDWAYVMDYERYGVVSAMVTHQGLTLKRALIKLQCGSLFSVVRSGYTPNGVWEACQLDTPGNKILGKPDYYTTPKLFDVFSRHDTKPWRDPPTFGWRGQPPTDV